MKRTFKVVAFIIYILVSIQMLLLIDNYILQYMVSSIIGGVGVGIFCWKLYWYSIEIDFKFVQELKKILKEILMYIPIMLLKAIINGFFITGTSINQQEVTQELLNSPIIYSIIIIIIGPIYEEGFFRLFPYIFMKNKRLLYIIITSLIFAGGHVSSSLNPLYYIVLYLISSIWYAYRYSHTEDVLVPVSIHMFNNLIAVIFTFIK